MDQSPNVFSQAAAWLFGWEGLTPHGFCLSWSPWWIGLFVAGNVLTAGAYTAIPFMLARAARKRREDVAQFRAAAWLTPAFVFSCATTHALMIATLFVPWYGLLALVTAGTGGISATAAWKIRGALRLLEGVPTLAELARQRRALERAHEDAERRFRRAPVAQHIMSPDGTILDVSDAWEKLMGWRREEVVGRPIADFKPEPRGIADERMRDLLARALTPGGVWNEERPLVHRDGRTMLCLVSAQADGPGGDGSPPEWVVASLQDVTDARATAEAKRRVDAELVATEETLRQSQKMEALGQLTGGIAHDFNNMLQAITGSMQMALSKLREATRPGGPGVTEELAQRLVRFHETGLAASGKAADLTLKLLGFARRAPISPVPFDPEEVLRKLEPVIKAATGGSIELRWQVEPGVGRCLADIQNVETGIINLVTNARDAILGQGSTGTITIIIGRQRIDVPAGPDAPRSGDYVRLAVRDDGPGMSEEVQRRAFEPFFTTKGVGRGTGLGLSITYGFARQSGGTVEIRSKPGLGTEVAMLLPRIDDGVEVEAPRGPGFASEDDAARGAGETILVVEDEPEVRATLEMTLEDLGYRVLQAENADQGLGILLARRPPEPQLVLSDMMMPGTMDGLQLVQEIRKRWPGMPTALVTGNLDEGRRAALPPGVVFVAKPYRRAALARTIRDLFDAAEAKAHAQDMARR